jgi:Mrp family chromosome partitioning ATPase
MRLGRRRPPVLAEISAGPPQGAGPGALRRGDMDAYGELLRRLNGSRAVLVTGEDEESGGAALGLATTAAATGRRTALVECDFAEPRLAGALGLAAAPGIGEYLRGEAEKQAILKPVVLTGPGSVGAGEPLICVVAGRPVAEAGSLLASDVLRETVDGLRAAYELVVLAGPSLRDEQTVRALQPLADATIACLGPTERRELPVPVSGVVIQG